MTLPIHELYQSLGDSICLGLTFFHAFTGCDSTSAFFSYPKNKWFEALMNAPQELYDEVTATFQQLS